MSESESVDGGTYGDDIAVEQLREAYSVAEDERARELIEDALSRLTDR